MPDIAEEFEKSSSETKLSMLDIATTIREPTPILVNILTLAAKDSSPSLRQFVAYRSSLFPALAPSLAVIVRPLVSDEVPAVRAAAITTLGNFTPPDTLQSPELLPLMSDDNLQVVSAAAAVAIERPEEPVQRIARAILPKLVGGLKSTSTVERAAVIYAIGRYGIVANPAVRPLTEVLRSDTETEIQLQAAVTLMKIGSREAQDSARPVLESFANGGNPALAQAAQTILQTYPGTTLMQQPTSQQPQGLVPPPQR
jgi:HEAT repeat protein